MTALYRELCSKVSHNIIMPDFYELLDSDCYKDIFSNNSLIGFIQYLITLKRRTDAICLKEIIKFIRHIALTRKIYDVYNEIILHTIASELYSLTDIEKFFSFYDNSEISMLCNTVITENGIVYNCCAVDFKYKFIFYCIRLNNKVLFEFLMNHYVKYAIELDITIADYTKDAWFIRDYPFDESYVCNVIADYETAILYQSSLRNTWIIACTLG